MPIIIKDCQFNSNGTGIKAPTSADIQMSGTKFVDNGKAIDIYVSVVDLQKLGLPNDTRTRAFDRDNFNTSKYAPSL